MKTIGVLLDHKVYRNIPSRKTGHERIELYHKAARKLGLNAFFISLQTVNVPRRQARGYVWTNGRYRQATKPIPKVIHNRALPFTQPLLRTLQRLGAVSYVFNSRNRYSKYRIHQWMSRSGMLRGSLPQTRKFGSAQLKEMMAAHGSLYVKPQSGSVGKGIYRISRGQGGQWKLRTASRSILLPKGQVYARLRGLVKGRPYLIQKDIELALYRGRPYDLRVSVQRGAGGTWRVTGIVGKVAGKGKHVTNVAQGGRTARCEVLFEGSGLPVQLTKLRVQRLALQITVYLASKLRRLADVGLDIGVDRTGKPYFIEANGRDQRYAFAKAGLGLQFYQTYENPIRYGAHLIRRK